MCPGVSFQFYFIFRFAASHLGLFCLPMSHKRDARLIWVKMFIEGIIDVMTQSLFPGKLNEDVLNIEKNHKIVSKCF